MKSFLKLAIIFIYYLFVSSNDAELKNDKIEIVTEFKNNHISKTEIHEIENRFDVKYKKLLFDNFHVIQKWINTFEHNAEHEYNKTDFVQKLKNYENKSTLIKSI